MAPPSEGKKPASEGGILAIITRLEVEAIWLQTGANFASSLLANGTLLGW